MNLSKIIITGNTEGSDKQKKIRDKSHHSLRKCHQVTSHLQQSSLTCHLTFNSIKFHLNTFGSVHGLEHSGGHFEMVQIRNIFGATAREGPSKLEGEKNVERPFFGFVWFFLTKPKIPSFFFYYFKKFPTAKSCATKNNPRAARFSNVSEFFF